jgi:hypothetical protein
MKKILFVGVAVILAVFLVTCDVFFPKEDEEVEYTDVVYSDDGSMITLYLDGVGVPLTKSMRAMSVRLSKMAYDYLDVVFVSGSLIARAQWELGQSAGISGVDRGGATGVNYGWSSGGGNPMALIVAGRKEGKTLLGIGDLRDVNNVTGTTVDADSKSVTFYVEAVKTALLVDSETNTATGNPLGILNENSFNYSGDSKRNTLGGVEYPTYALPLTGSTDETYIFNGAAATFKGELAIPTGRKVMVEPRIPRYLEAGRYMSVKAVTDFRSTVDTTGGPLTTYTNEIPLTFTVKGSGSSVFSFYIDIPVYVLTGDEGTNTGKLPAILWHIRTGLGSELYSLDDGLSSGGCVLMGIGEVDLDWLDIEWDWLE